MRYTQEQIVWAIANAGKTFFGGKGVQPQDILWDLVHEVAYLHEIVERYQSVEVRMAAVAMRPIQFTVMPEQAQTLIGMPQGREHGDDNRG